MEEMREGDREREGKKARGESTFPWMVASDGDTVHIYIYP
jgi:hypothetical protein